MDDGSGNLVNIVRPINLVLTGGPYDESNRELLDRARKEILETRGRTPAVDLLLEEHPDALDVFAYESGAGGVIYKGPQLPADLRQLQKQGQKLLQACANLPEVNAENQDNLDVSWRDTLHHYLRPTFASYHLQSGVGAWCDPTTSVIHKVNFPDIGSLNQLVVFVINEFAFRTKKEPAYSVGLCPRCLKLFLKPRIGTDYCHPYCRTVWGKESYNRRHLHAGTTTPPRQAQRARKAS